MASGTRPSGDKLMAISTQTIFTPTYSSLTFQLPPEVTFGYTVGSELVSVSLRDVPTIWEPIDFAWAIEELTLWKRELARRYIPSPKNLPDVDKRFVRVGPTLTMDVHLNPSSFWLGSYTHHLAPVLRRVTLDARPALSLDWAMFQLFIDSHEELLTLSAGM